MVIIIKLTFRVLGFVPLVALLIKLFLLLTVLLPEAAPMSRRSSYLASSKTPPCPTVLPSAADAAKFKSLPSLTVSGRFLNCVSGNRSVKRLASIEQMPNVRNVTS